MLIARIAAIAVLTILAPCVRASETALDLQLWFVEYGDLWWQPSAAALDNIEERYALPYYLLLESGPVVMDKAALKRFLSNVRRVPDWGGSRIRQMTVTLLNSRSGRVEAEWQDFSESGDARGACFAYEYAVAKFDSGWKIVAVTQRPCPMSQE